MSIVLNRFACTVAAVLVVAACAHPTSDRYGGAEVGKTIETSRGTVVSGRLVDINGETTPVGPLAGAAIGGAGVGLGTHSGWAAILGAVFGAGLGYVTQEFANDREGIEYILDMEDGRTVTLVQNREKSEEPVPSGTPVLVQMGGDYTRVVPRTPSLDRPAGGSGSIGSEPSGATGGAGGGWVDPDKSANTPSASSPAPASGTPPGTQSSTAPAASTGPAPQQTTGQTTGQGSANFATPPATQGSSWAAPPPSQH